MTFVIPAAPPRVQPMPLQLLEELQHIASQAETLSEELSRLELSPEQLELLRPGALAQAQRITCQLETAAELVRGLE